MLYYTSYFTLASPQRSRYLNIQIKYLKLNQNVSIKLYKSQNLLSDPKKDINQIWEFTILNT